MYSLNFGGFSYKTPGKSVWIVDVGVLSSSLCILDTGEKNVPDFVKDVIRRSSSIVMYTSQDQSGKQRHFIKG